jgi:Zn-dependent M28 family amino/carboxypeptidase
VLGYVEGSDKKDEWLIVTSHYDHEGIKNGKIYYGADDDGSGTVGVMEMAEAFAKAKAEGKGPRRNVLFMTVSGEEKGLWGSEYYSEHPTVPMEKVTADLNIDMIGRRDTLHPKTNNYVYVIGSDRLSSELHTINEEVNAKYTQLELDYKYNDRKDPERIYFRSDHYNFAKKGIPAIFFFNGIHADYHQSSDTPDKIEYDALAKRTQLAFVLAWELANRPDRIKVDRDGK